MEFKKYDKIHQLGHEDNQGIFSNPNTEVCIQEKVDGANFRVYIKDGKLIFGSRTQELNAEEEIKTEKNFRRAVQYVKDKLKDINLTEWNGLTLFMENMVKHTINYNWDITPPVVGYDIYIEVEGEEPSYLGWNSAKKIFEDFGFEFIPIIKICKASEIVLPITDETVPQSKYTMQKAEGIVFKTFSPRIYAKYVRTEFKEKNKEVFGGGKKHAETDEDYFVAVYCTNYRIEKQVMKLIDEGMVMDRKMMKFLPNKVFDDIWEENYQDIIYTKQKTICFDTFRKKVTSRCLIVLDQMIQNNLLNGKENN